MEPVIATGNINDDAPSNRIMTRQCMVTAAPIGLDHHRLNTTGSGTELSIRLLLIKPTVGCPFHDTEMEKSCL